MQCGTHGGHGGSGEARPGAVSALHAVALLGEGYFHPGTADLAIPALGEGSDAGRTSFWFFVIAAIVVIPTLVLLVARLTRHRGGGVQVERGSRPSPALRAGRILASRPPLTAALVELNLRRRTRDRRATGSVSGAWPVS